MSRRLLALASVLALGVAAPAASADVSGDTHDADYLAPLEAPDTTPATIDGAPAEPLLTKGDRLRRGQTLLRVRVSGPANAGIRLRLTCPAGARIAGYGYDGPDGMAVNGRPLLDRRTVRPKVQAALDVNDDGRFTGLVVALCE
ncbi:MAG TPA: hypothetical protein VN238_05670 [Solirubrobacteraceae bacterium]|nr:hypothetical protein [Solirubrobacteraceae bacterium]